MDTLGIQKLRNLNLVKTAITTSTSKSPQEKTHQGFTKCKIKLRKNLPIASLVH